MTDHTKRLNKVVTDALNASPYSRAYHDDYYGKDRVYTYAFDMNADHKTAYLLAHKKEEQAGASTKLVLNMAKDDVTLVNGVHHNLTRIHQRVELDCAGITQKLTCISLNDYTTLMLMRDIQVNAMEQEGPLRGFFQSLEQNSLDKIAAYKAYAAHDQKAFRVYSAALFQHNALQVMPIEQAVDRIGFHYMNDFRNQPASKKERAFVKARQAMAHRFTHDPALSSASLSDSIVAYHALQNSPKGRCDARVRDYFKGRGPMKMEELSIDTISEVLTIRTGLPFLTEDEWQAALGGENSTEVLGEVVKDISFHKSYKDVTERHKEVPEKERTREQLLDLFIVDLHHAVTYHNALKRVKDIRAKNKDKDDYDGRYGRGYDDYEMDI